MNDAPATVAIVGAAGGVGSATAYTLIRDGVAADVVLVDERTNVVASHVMDLDQLRALGTSSRARAGVEADLRDAAVVVLSASAPLRSNTTRRDYLADNLPIARKVGRALAGSNWRGVVLVATNPIEPMCRALRDAAGLTRHQVIGYTLNDTLRLRSGIAHAIGVTPDRVDAWALGEHGEHVVALWSRISVDGVRVRLDGASRTFAGDYLASWYSRIVALDSGRTTTWSTAAGLSRMVAAALRTSDQVFPGAVALDGEYGIRDCVLGVPLRLGPGGASELLEWSIDADERDGLERAAAMVRAG